MDRLITKNPKVVLSPLRIPITRSIHLPLNYRQLLFSKPTVKLSLLRTSFIGGTMRLGSSSQRNLAPCNRYPTINKCNSRKCLCCKFLNMSSFILSSVNNRKFSVNIKSDVSWNSMHVVYVITWNVPCCGAQYVGQTGRSLKTRFREHFFLN